MSLLGFSVCIRGLGTADKEDLPRFDFVERQEARWKELAQVVQPIGGRLEYHNRDPAARQVLLVVEVCIQGNQRIKVSFRETQKFPVLPTGPARFLHGKTFVAMIQEELPERSWRALIDQNSHLS